MKKIKKTQSKKKSKVSSRKQDIRIIKDRCKGCQLCVIYCPTDTLIMSDEVNEKGNFVPIVKDINLCKGCNLCFKFCPDFAIFCVK
jgi:2-oxoglutarate ferredoxin oxidoreductase subunit delta